MGSILSVSYESALLATRQQILQSKGYAVTSVCGASEALEVCFSNARFDLLVLGHSIPYSEKEAIIEASVPPGPRVR